MMPLPDEAAIRQELRMVARHNDWRSTIERIQPWWERRIEYLTNAGRRQQIAAEGLLTIRMHARGVKRRMRAAAVAPLPRYRRAADRRVA
jgi:hypothetical protein